LTYLSQIYEDWQVKQADLAIKLYNFFLFKNKQDKGKFLTVGLILAFSI